MVLEMGHAAAGIGLEPKYQPIVSLPDEVVVGFEALARWPTGDGVGPDRVFAHANATGRIEQLDAACVDAAIEGALRSRLGRNAMLCINCEPNTAHLRRADLEIMDRGHRELQLVFELTERGLLSHPHALLRKVAALRADGFAVALDDVGAHPDSLALLDVLSPDIVKLDLALVQTHPDTDRAKTLSAVLAHHERTGAVILAEGIETSEHLEQALALGATLGQGYRFGHPAALAPRFGGLGYTLAGSRQNHVRDGTASPFDIVAGRCPVRTARKEILTAFSHHIEGQANHAADPPIVLAALQHVEHFTPATRQRYLDLAAKAPLVAIFGEALPTWLGEGLRGVALDAADPLCAEWSVVTLGPHSASALIAREHGLPDATVDDDHRRFDFIITYDRTLVTEAACALLDRIS